MQTHLARRRSSHRRSPMHILRLALGDEDGAMSPTQDDCVLEFVEDGPVWWNLGREDRYGEARSPCVVANLDAVVLQGKVIAVPGPKRTRQGGECLGQYGWGNDCRTWNL